MAITPSGNPAWVRSNDHTAYGGHANKANYASVDSVNPRTDVNAQNLTRIAADIAAIARTAPFAVMTYTNNDTGTTDPTVDSYSAMAGAAPTGARVSDGIVTFTWSSSYPDPYSVSGDIHIAGATITVHGSSDYAVAITPSDPDANGKNERVQIEVVDASTGSAATDTTVTVAVYTAPV